MQQCGQAGGAARLGALVSPMHSQLLSLREGKGRQPACGVLTPAPLCPQSLPAPIPYPLPQSEVPPCCKLLLDVVWPDVHHVPPPHPHPARALGPVHLQPPSCEKSSGCASPSSCSLHPWPCSPALCIMGDEQPPGKLPDLHISRPMGKARPAPTLVSICCPLSNGDHLPYSSGQATEITLHASTLFSPSYAHSFHFDSSLSPP